MRRAVLLVASVGVVSASAACGKKLPPADAVGVSATVRTSSKHREQKRVTARPLVTLNGATLGPYLAHQGDGYLMAYVSSTESELVAMPLLADGAPAGSAKILGRVPPETNALAVRPLGRNGYALLLKRPNERGETLEVVGIQADGAPFGKLAPLTTSQGRVVWFDVLRTGAASVAVWAEDGDGGDVTLFSQPLEGNGKPVGVPLRVGKRAVAWSASYGQNGAAIAWIARESALVSEGPLLVQRFDKQGQLDGVPVTVAPKARARDEIEMVYAKGAYVLGWTDAIASPSQAMVAAVQEDGKIDAPRPIMRRARSSDLARLVATPSAGWVAAWRDGLGTTGALQGRLVVGALAGEPTSILYVAPKEPVFGSLLEHGSAWLLSAKPCGGNDVSCDESYEPELHLVDGSQHRVVRLEDEVNRPLAVAWDLSCDPKQCVNLAASPGNPTTVYSITTSLTAPAEKKGRQAEPPVPSVVVSEFGGAVVGLAASNGLTATLSETHAQNHFVLQATPFGESLEPPKVQAPPLTRTAVLGGGVSMAPGPKDEGAVVAWVADDAGVEHVHLARVDKAGQRKNHVLLTQQKGDKGTVCVARLGAGADQKAAEAGYVVAWIDERASEPQIYATRVTNDLTRVARETKITEAPGDKSELGCAVVEDRVVLTWVDTRDDPSHTRGDIFTVNVRPRDLATLAPDHAVLATGPRSYSPLLRIRGGKEATVTWLESGATPTESYVFEAALVGAAGAPVRRKVPATAVQLVGGPATDRTVILVSEGRRLSLYEDGGKGDATRLGWLVDSPAPGAPALLDGTRLLFGEAGPQPALRAFSLP